MGHGSWGNLISTPIPSEVSSLLTSMLATVIDIEQAYCGFALHVAPHAPLLCTGRCSCTMLQVTYIIPSCTMRVTMRV
jgi:hypothetical protein